MSDVSGIPNMGFGGGGYFGGNAATGQPAMSAAQINAGMWGNYSPGAAQATLNNIYGAGGFGAQPAYYAALGAAYGRQVPQSSPAAVAAAGGQEARLRALYPQAFRGGGIGSDAARAPDAVSTPKPNVPVSQDWESTFTNTVSGNPDNPTVLGDSSWYPSQRTPVAPVGPYSSAFSYNPASMAGGGQEARLRALYPGAFSGDIGSSPMARPMPNLGYNPGMANSFANPAMNANPFQNRFGMGFPNAGTPSQVMPGYGHSLTPTDIYSAPHSLGPQSNLNWYGQPNASS